MESVNDVKEALSARSRTATLDELRSEGRKRVRIIRAEHVQSMITEAVNSAVEQSGLISPEEVQKLVEKSRQQFRTMMQEAQQTTEVQEQLEARDREIAELKQRLEQMTGGKGGGGAASVPVSGDLSAVLAKIEGSINDRLEKIGKKMGVSAAVESDAPVDFSGLFKAADKKLESNMENVEAKKTEGGGIAANLARLKKLKGGS
jgi:DNA-binding protein YbaB